MSILDHCKGNTMYKTGFHFRKGRFTLKQTPPVGLFHVNSQHPVNFLVKFSMDKSIWSKTASLSPRKLKPMSHYLICIEMALLYLLIHKIIQRSGVFNCHNYCKSSTDHTSQPWMSSSHDLLIPSASTGQWTAKQPNHSTMPMKNSVKKTCSPLSHQ